MIDGQTVHAAAVPCDKRMGGDKRLRSIFSAESIDDKAGDNLPLPGDSTGESTKKGGRGEQAGFCQIEQKEKKIVGAPSKEIRDSEPTKILQDAGEPEGGKETGGLEATSAPRWTGKKSKAG